MLIFVSRWILSYKVLLLHAIDHAESSKAYWLLCFWRSSNRRWQVCCCMIHFKENQILTSFSPFTSDFFQKEMSRMFPWKVTFLRHHYQLATGECTSKRAVIRRRRRGLPERLSRLSCGVWDFKWEPACIVSIQLHCQLRAITLFLWVCQKFSRRKDLLLREYLTVSTISLLPSFGLKDVLPWHNHKIWGKN